MGGFLNLRLKKWARELSTKFFTILPIILVALFFDTSDASLDVLNEWLNVLQSIHILFALIPLLTLVSKKEIMCEFRIRHKTKANPFDLFETFFGGSMGGFSGMV